MTFDDFDEEIMMKKDFVEIEVLSGKRFLLENNWEKVYNLAEKSWYSFKLSSKFPFISFEKHRYCTFKFSNNNSLFDKKFKVNCDLSQLAALFDIDFKKFDLTMVNHDVTKP